MSNELDHNAPSEEEKKPLTLELLTGFVEYIQGELDEVSPQYLCILTNIDIEEEGQQLKAGQLVFGVDDNDQLVEVLRFALKQPPFQAALQEAIDRDMEEAQKGIQIAPAEVPLVKLVKK